MPTAPKSRIAAGRIDIDKAAVKRTGAPGASIPVPAWGKVVTVQQRWDGELQGFIGKVFPLSQRFPLASLGILRLNLNHRTQGLW